MKIGMTTPSEVLKMELGLGIDTGGTYTDAVLMELGTDRILCKSKSPTTREDLALGIGRAIKGLDAGLLDDIRIVSLSSTLATNSIVEGKGARIALICIGEDYESDFPADISVRVAGRHGIDGSETEPLDEASVRTFLESIEGKADGIAVAGFLSVRNPSHENRVKEMAESLLDIPVICGHDLSSGLGFNERAVTCIMNAHLIPLMTELMDSVVSVLSGSGIAAPLMVIRGDGSMMSASEARRRPVETILSGPAASMIGASRMSGLSDAIVIDMGGTTTDIGILRNGRPAIEKEGAVIEGFRTRVRAARISTTGIGGDSRIAVDAAGGIRVMPTRVMPICRAAQEWPTVRESIRSLKGSRPRLAHSAGAGSPIPGSEFFILLRRPSDPSAMESSILDALADGPQTAEGIADRLGIHPASLRLDRLEMRGSIQRIGFTPTDVLHSKGVMNQFDTESSHLVASYLAAGIRMEADTFLDRCLEEVVEGMGSALLRDLVLETTGDAFGSAMDGILASMALKGGSDILSCHVQTRLPIVGIGAPACTYIPLVAGLLGTNAVICEDSDVGNAVGTVSAMIHQSVYIVIRPDSLGKEEGYKAFSRMGMFEYISLDDALSDSEDRAKRIVSEEAVANGADGFSFTVERHDRTFTYGDTGIDCLMEVELVVTAEGLPRPFDRRFGRVDDVRREGRVYMRGHQDTIQMGTTQTIRLLTNCMFAPLDKVLMQVPIRIL